ncbi:DEAD/DEAH box helicase [Enemella sp. A6]|uniref:DEAD/DEAH box helicase n=1 Tax=Enemella sp. A6 TaxID=3440152 RepID=UPI003EBF6AE1
MAAARRRNRYPELTDFGHGYSFEFDEYQVEACQYVEDGSGVLVAAPTGAGKTIVGEFAVHLALSRGRKAFYTTPIKALSNQKYHDLVERHGAEHVGLLTGDTSINSEASVVVMTTEVLRNMIYASSPTLNNLGFVVMDEVHYLADRFRGAVWEEVIIGLPESVQMICLSATVSNAEEFGEWLGEVRGDMQIVVSEKRPVPLYQHVMVGRKLYDLFAEIAPTAVVDDDASAPTRWSVNPQLVNVAKTESRTVRDDSRRPRGRKGRGKKSGYGSGAYGGAAHGRHQDRSQQRRRTVPTRPEMVEALDRANLLPAIVFIFSRAGCDAAVRQLQTARVRLTTAEEELAILQIVDKHITGLSEADLRALRWDDFLDALLRGVASHHAGLLPAFKELVEECFVSGLIKVVFATETLALGINMPARSVVLEKLVKFNGETHADITPGEYTQLTGRAGRRGIDVEGHAVVLWQPGLDPRAVAGLASRRTYPLRSSFAPTYNMAVNMVGRVGRDQARTLLEQSFAQFQTDGSVVGLARQVARNQQAIGDHLAALECDRGDFMSYARLREAISEAETEAARARRSDSRAVALDTLAGLQVGDIIGVPSGKHAGWALVVDTSADNREGPRPQVLTAAHHIRRLSPADFPTAPVILGRMKVPKRFNPRERTSRRAMAAAFDAKLKDLDTAKPIRRRAGEMDEETRQRIAELRAELASHPCHTCPDREAHARRAEKVLRLESENAAIEQKVKRRTSTIAAQFDRICLVLQSLGYLAEGETEQELVVTDAGRLLSRIYAELDLVAAEAIRDGIFDGLSHPQLAAVLSTLIFESRRDDGDRYARMPDRETNRVVDDLRRIRHRIDLLERDARIERGRDLDIGFAATVFAWAAGESLAQVLVESKMTAGDFVRWVRQVIDFADQVADAAGPGDLRRTAREAVHAMRRGIVDLEQDPGA